MIKNILVTGLGFALLASPLLASADTLTDLKAQILSVHQQIQALQTQLAALEAQYKAACVAPQINFPTSPYPIQLAPGQVSTQNISATENVTWKIAGAPWATTTANTLTITAPTTPGVYNFNLFAINVCNLQTKAQVQVTVSKVGSSSGIVISAGTQPANTNAWQGAHVAFTKFTLTNNSASAATISGITVQNVGTGNDAAVANIYLNDESGAVVSGPASLNPSTHQAQLSDTFTIGAGQTKTYTLYAAIGTNVGAYAGGVLSFNVVAINSSPAVSGNLPISGAKNVIGAGAINVSLSSSPAPQAVIAGSSAVPVANVQFDATRSSEDVRFGSLPLVYTDNMPVDPSDCVAYNGSTQLTSGSHVINVSNSSPTQAYTFTFDSSLIVPKGQVTTISIKCDIPPNATGSFSWGLSSGTPISGTGMTTMSSISATVAANPGPVTTIAQSGALYVSVDPSSPGFALVAAGSNNVIASIIKVHASNAPVTLTALRLQLANSICGTTSTADGLSSNGCSSDVTGFSIYNGTSLVGTGTFLGTRSATSTINGVSIPANGDVLLTVKVNLAPIGVAQPGGIGDIVKVDPLSAQGTSVGLVVNASAATGAAGLRIFKTFPTLGIMSATCTNSTSCLGPSKVLKKISISASPAGSVGLYKVPFVLSMSSAQVSNVRLYAYSDSNYSLPIAGQGAGGQVGATYCATACGNGSPVGVTASTSPVEIPAGGTVYFALVGTVTPLASSTSWVVSALLPGDTQLAGIKNAYTAPGNLIWSDNASTTAQPSDADWTNGYFLPGLPSSGADANVPAMASHWDSSSLLANALSAFGFVLRTLLTPIGF